MSKNTKLFTGFVVMGLVLSLAVVSTVSAYTFTQTLKLGSSGAEVMELQKVLNSDPVTQVSATGVGSKGNETTYFGGLTKAAVIKFQNKYASEVLAPVGLTSGTGLVGAMSRAKLNNMSGTVGGGNTGGTLPTGCTSTSGYSPVTGQPCSSTVPPATPTGTGLSVTDPGQPGPSLAPESAARIPFTKVRLSAGTDGDVTVNSITVERTGLAADVSFSGVVILDENGLQIGDSKTFNSNHQAIVGSPFVVKAGTSKVITIAGNMASDNDARAGQVASLTVVGVNTNGATVSGALPVTGATHTINATLSLGSATLIASSFDPNTAATKEIGTTAYRFAGIRLTAGSAEKTRLWSVRWYQSGSSASGDLANIKTYVDGVAYDTSVSADGKYFTSLFPGGILIDKGASKDVWVAGDLVGASSANRTVQFDIYKTTDIYLTGETFGYGVTPSANGNCATTATTGTEFLYSSASCAGTASTPWFSGSLVTISAGSATSITKSSAVAAQNIAAGVPNQPLGGFETDIKGEPISVQSLVFNVATTSGSASSPTTDGMLTNVTIVDQNGAVVAGPVDATGTSAAQVLTFTDTVTFPIGKRVYTLKGQAPASVGNNTTYIVSTTPSSGWTNVTGLVSGNTISLSANGVLSMNTMTVKTGSLTITMASTPASQTIVAGGNAREFANYQLDASQSGEDIRLSSMKGSLTFGTANTADNLSGCQLFNGSSALNNSTVVNPANGDTTGDEYTFTFDTALIIPKGTVKTLTLKCNISSSAASTETFAWGIENTAANITPTGITSGTTITESVTASAGNTMTIGSGSIAVSTDASSPSYKLVAGGTTGQVIGVYKLESRNESINLSKLGLSITNTASSSARDLVNVTVWANGVQVSEPQTFTGTNTTATTTLTKINPSGVVITKDVSILLTIKADLANIGNSESATSSGHFIAIDYLNGEGTGVESGATKYTTGSTAVAGVRVFKSYPTFEKDTLSSTGVADGKLLRFKVTAVGKDASATGSVGLTKFEFTLATTTASVLDFNLFAFTDSQYSQPVSGIGSSGQVQNANACVSGTGCTSSPTIAIYAQTTAGATTTIQIPVGSTYYFEARASVTGSASGASVITTLKGDSAFPNIPAQAAFGSVQYTMSSTTRIDAVEAQNSFIWSPNSTTTSVAADADWTNGYGVYGLPSSGMIQNRGN